MISILVLFILVWPYCIQGKNLSTIGEIYDGTPRDIAAGDGVLYLAQGRHLALIDPLTGLRIGNYTEQPYPEQLVAVEFDPDNNRLFVATEKQIFLYDHSGKTQKVWRNPTTPRIGDFKIISSDSKIIAVISDTVKIIDYSANDPFVVSSFYTPAGISFFQRIHIAETRHGYMAYLNGAVTGQLIRGVNGLIIVDLDSHNEYLSPTVYPEFWNPVAHFGTPAATVLNVQVVENYSEDRTIAFVACGTAGQLTLLDVTDPSAISFQRRIELFAGFPVFNLVTGKGNSRLYAASANILHTIDLRTMEVMGTVNAGFYNAGDRDMALFDTGQGEIQLWTATHQGVGYVINAVNVTADRPVHDLRQWWISSSDGAVAVPEWNSVYLPTFGGIVRYDVSNPAFPVAVNESYQPAGGIVEHIDIVFPDPEDKNNALLITAPGSGGVQAWAVSRNDPNPGEPQKYFEKPALWGNDLVYQNDVAHFRKDGINFFLADLSNRKTHEIALQIYNTSTGEWLNVFENSPELTSNSKTVRVWGNYAFVTCTGGFFVVDLSGLPNEAGIVDIVINDWNDDGKPDDVASLVVSDDGRYLFISHRPGVVQSYQFDAETGRVTGPLDILSDGIFGSTSPGGSYYDPLKRLYIPAGGGNIMEIDVSDPSALSLLSVWNNGGYFGEMQDCKIYEFDGAPTILAVKNNEGFALLKIDTGDLPEISKGLVAHWTFDNDSNQTVIDASPNRLNGTAYHIQYEEGPVSGAAVFNGFSSRIDIPDMHLTPPAAIGNLETGSISLWFKFQNQGGDILPLLYFGESNGALPHKSLILEIGHNQDPNDRRLYFTIIVAPFNVTKFCFDTGFNLDEDTWYHFAAVVSENGNTGYLNGEELTGRRYNLGSNATYTDFFSSVTAKELLSLGYGRYGRNFSFFHFKGSLDDVRIYDRPLSLHDVETLYGLGTTSTAITERDASRKETKLIRNFPNPFRLATNIQWNMEKGGEVSIEIFDMTGRKVRSLVNGYFLPGIHETLFDTEGLLPGIYFCRMQAGNYFETIKMMAK